MKEADEDVDRADAKDPPENGTSLVRARGTHVGLATALTTDDQRALNKRRPPFSAQATDALLQRVAEFESDLGELAMTAAAREGDNVVSDHHVERAAQFLIARSKDRLASLARDVGGIALGTGGGALISCAMAGIGGVWLAVSVGLTTVGTGLFFRFSR